MARKAGVAIGGGALTTLGLVMIPLPTPFGVVVAGADMAVLGTEFPEAQAVLDKTRDVVVDVIEKNCSSSDGEEEDDDDTKNNNDRNNHRDEEDGDASGDATTRIKHGEGKNKNSSIDIISSKISKDEEDDSLEPNDEH